MQKLFSVALLLLAPALLAQAPSKQDEIRDHIVTSSHTMRIAGQTVAYKAEAGTLVLRNESGAPRASFFVVAYKREGSDPATRPVTFTFNGGPGSSSVWLHMGAFGPKRVVYADDTGNATRPPYRLTDNEASILDVSDLVFIDPVTTGFSRAVPHEDAKKFHGYEADIESVGELIRLWTTKNGRWSSPKFLAGESYGTTRAAGLAAWLQAQGYYLNGVMLISSILNFQTARFDSGNDLPYILFLPTYTATAWYHRRLPEDLQRLTLEQVFAASEDFALGEYATALMRGDKLTDAARASAVANLARFTGLTPRYIEQTNLRIDISRFDKELLRDQRRTVGRLDSRFTGIDVDAAGERPEFDPSYASIYGEYTAVLNDWVRRGLRYETDLPYEILTGKVRPWSYEKQQNHYLDASATLREAMSRNPDLQVLVANGYYDLATPVAATHYTFNRLQLDPSLRGNITMTYYPSGHMMYIERTSRLQLRDDVVGFIRRAAGGETPAR